MGLLDDLAKLPFNLAGPVPGPACCMTHLKLDICDLLSKPMLGKVAFDT